MIDGKNDIEIYYNTLFYLLRVLYIRGLTDESAITKGKYIFKALAKHKDVSILSGAIVNKDQKIIDGEVKPDFNEIISFRENFEKLNGGKTLDEHNGIEKKVSKEET